ncbi:hypothetical protein E7Z59_08430 [Robertkochia marina]|uniref:Uncharacterized protein n=1 Tax=Robertkochia marina TaxID=1227945 RepID=A0A4S3M0Y6_9FLAO|nr:hypothetical protein [Robertkochia marina]THD67673.1 hypothetical protein E7Z59_08430 [Robertkochia marina]TRZ43404.1 hypothetical protein D3A96_10570 [Robertkochia marina]
MKNFKFLQIAFLAVIFLSCSKDEDTPMQQETGTVSIELTNVLVDQEYIGAKGASVMNATSCQFPDLPTITIPSLFTVKFKKNGADAYVFNDVTAGTNAFDVVLDQYDIEVISNNYNPNPVTLEVILESDVQTVDFRTQKTLNVLMNTKQSLILLARENVDISNGNTTLTAPDATVTGLTLGYTDYVGVYVKSDVFSGGTLSFQDTQGTIWNETLPTLEYGKIYRYLVCPDSEVGISVATGIFEDAPNDIIVE